MTHIEALENCLANSAIDTETKSHLTAIKTQLETHTAHRKVKKDPVNMEIFNMINTQMNDGKEHTFSDIVDNIEKNGITDNVVHRVRGIIAHMDLEKTSTLSAENKKITNFKRSSTIC